MPGETPRTENLEAEKNPAILENSIDAVDGRESSDSFLKSEWMQKAKEIIKKIRPVFAVGWFLAGGIFKIIKGAVTGEKMSFKKGFEMGWKDSESKGK